MEIIILAFQIIYWGGKATLVMILLLKALGLY